MSKEKGRSPTGPAEFALTVTADILVTVGWLSMLVILADTLPGNSAVGIASARAFVARILPLIRRGQTAHPEWGESDFRLSHWTLFQAATALLLLLATRSTFEPTPRAHARPSSLA